MAISFLIWDEYAIYYIYVWQLQYTNKEQNLNKNHIL